MWPFSASVSCVPLLLGGVLHKCRLDPDGPPGCPFLLTPWPSSCLPASLWLGKDGSRLQLHSGICIFLLSVLPGFLSRVLKLCRQVHSHVVFLGLLGEMTPLWWMYSSCLSLVTFSVLVSVLFDIKKTSRAFWFFRIGVCMVDLFPFSFHLPESLCLRWVSCRWHALRSSCRTTCKWWVIYHVIIGKFRLRSTVLHTFSFCLLLFCFSCFFFPDSFWFIGVYFSISFYLVWFWLYLFA